MYQKKKKKKSRRTKRKQKKKKKRKPKEKEEENKGIQPPRTDLFVSAQRTTGKLQEAKEAFFATGAGCVIV